MDWVRHVMAFNPSSLFGIGCVQCGNELIALKARSTWIVRSFAISGDALSAVHGSNLSLGFRPKPGAKKDLKRKVDVFPPFRVG